MNFLIDTNICIYIMNEKPIEVIQKFKNTEIGQIGISSITVSELYYGVSKSKFRKQNARRLEEFLIPFDILPYDENASKIYGEIRAQLESQGSIIGPLDLLIAAHAMSNDLILITNNEDEFRRIASLKIENWVG
ncbi:MAG: twitching motility protein PilT [Desulfobacterales bacterium RIFOXYA12_FULL_46_15]|nr:MAG: twitching motility protein PilT [Desulfobacula sp. GWF2_41_7]OGR26335.1 MAG: twitching motility protein PilT [Desulfobacterales bacterium RIFOXYA12_FULL_46_15]